MTLIILRGAELDIAAAADWYEREQLGASAAFYDALARVLESIESMPESFALEETVSPRQLRRGLLRRYPYKVVFEIISQDTTVVHAVAHTSRHPESWVDRLS